MFIVILCRLSRSTADEEPLVDGSVDLRGGKLLVRRQRRQGLSRDTAGGVLNGRVGAKKKVSRADHLLSYGQLELDLRRDAARLGLAGNEALPGLTTLTNDVHGVAVILSAKSSSKSLHGWKKTHTSCSCTRQ